MGQFSFPKKERLNQRSAIEDLFKKGAPLLLYPLKVIAQTSTDQRKPHQVLFSVSARNFKRAVDRNLIKRRLREAYRINKSLLPQSPKLQIAYIYVAKEILDFDRIEEKLIESMNRLHQYAQKG